MRGGVIEVINPNTGKILSIDLRPIDWSLNDDEIVERYFVSAVMGLKIAVQESKLSQDELKNSAD